MAQVIQTLLDGRRDLANAGALRGPVGIEEFGAVRGLIALVVEIETRVAQIGIGLVADRRIDAIAQHPVTAGMGGQKQHCVGGDQFRLGQVGRIARRRAATVGFVACCW